MKARQQGNASVLTIPAKFNVEANTELVGYKGEHGSITYIPKQENIFETAVINEDSLRTPLDEEYTYEIKE